ncbi:hypothetical protein Sjap_017660 [Stephania japonica]|uniref:Uncharacterized protein n=1 Tax=Stephania japonica TaxID=461633 RepID=A0AAP0NKN5_9MAGN
MLALLEFDSPTAFCGRVRRSTPGSRKVNCAKVLPLPVPKHDLARAKAYVVPAKVHTMPHRARLGKCRAASCSSRYAPCHLALVTICSASLRAR